MSSPYNFGEPTSRMREPNAVFLDRLVQGHYDFIDLGTCEGGGFEIAKRQGGQRGLGFDLEPHYVEMNFQKGLDVACVDVRTLSAKPYVDFSICSHILEHLPNIHDVGSVLNASSGLCRDYILISGPCFEDEEYLWNLKVKLLHSAMTDHTCKFKVIELVTLLHTLRLRDFTIGFTGRIHGSDSIWVHSAEQPVPPEGLWTWDAGKHRPKPAITFDREIYRDIVCVVPLRTGVDSQAILDKFLWGYDKIAFRSSWYL